MAVYTYLFEARGIQRFLFATGKLKDMLNGSELIDYICAENGYVDQVLKSLDLTNKVQAPRKAGGAFYLAFTEELDAKRFQAAWRLASSQWLPTVERVDVLSTAETIKDAIAEGLRQLAQARNQIEVELPNTSPITERSPRTGLAAVTRLTDAGGRESVDLSTYVVRKFERPRESTSLTDRFLPNQNLSWPDNFEEDAKEKKRFPLGRHRLVGLIHADGNGLGQILRQLNEACQSATDEVYINLYKTFSEGITTATVEAAKQASKEVLLPHAEREVMPARPLVLGGDDLSIIVRADLAIPFTQAFLKAFKHASEIEIKKLKDLFKQYDLTSDVAKLPDYLTACAGIVFMKASQPFYTAYSLAEGLCTQAKNYSRQHLQTTSESVGITPSSLAFYKVGDSLLDDVDAMYLQTLVAQHGQEQYQLSMPAYFVDEHLEREANLEQLLELQQFLITSSLNESTLREITTLVYLNIAQAKSAYRRWCEYSERGLSAKEQKQVNDIEEFHQQLAQILGKLEQDLPFHKVSQTEYQSILADVLTLFTIAGEAPAVKLDTQVAGV